MRCGFCKADNPRGFSFCGYCGHPLPALCPRCGLENPRDFSFCGHCGADLSQLISASSTSALEGERRFAVILVADIAGFTPLTERLDAEAAAGLVNRCLDEMTRVVVQRGGRVDRYTGDGLVAVFGAPTAHEDDPERALRAASAMQEAVGEIEFDGVSSLSLHIGLACGQVVAAGVGGEGRWEYTVVGTPVNRAYRLQELSAPGQTLVCEELVRLTEGDFSFSPLTTSGLSQEVETNTFEFLGENLRPQTDMWPLVGREAEMTLLRRHLDDLANGEGRFLSIIGEAGVGKSRLLQELRASSVQQDHSPIWLEGEPNAREGIQSYGWFLSLLHRSLGLSDIDDIGQGLERFRANLDTLMPGEAQEVYKYLSWMLGVRLETAEPVWVDTPDVIKWRTFGAVQNWLMAMAREKPVVLICEDMHWLDPASAELLEQLVPLVERVPLLVIGVYRPEVDSLAWRLRERVARTYRARYAELWLQPLPLPEAEELVVTLLGTDRVSPDVLASILRRTEGNPLFIEEIVRSMVEEGMLIRDDSGGYVLVEREREMAIPDTVQAIFQSRIDRLEGEIKKVLQIAACIGRRFSYDMLVAVAETCGVPQARLDRSLQRLEKARMIRREEESEYTFYHRLVRDILHAGLLQATRSQYHTIVAQWYEENSPGPSPPYELLAYHYGQTDDYEKQRRYFALAGHQAAQRYANQDACTFFGQALALTTDLEERFDLLVGRERVLDLLSERAQQRADLEELGEIVETLGDAARAAVVYNRMAYWFDTQGDYPAAIAAAEKGLAAARKADDAKAEAGNLHRIASAAWRQGRFTAALAAAQEAVEVAHLSGDAEREASALTTMGVIYRSQGHLDEARACYQQALDIHRAIGDRKGEAVNLCQLGNLLYDEGDYAGSYNRHQEAIEIFRFIGDRQGEAWALGGLGSVYLACGAHDQARECMEKALSLRRSVGDRRGEAVNRVDLGSVLLAQGDAAGSLLHLEKAIEVLRAIGARRDETYALVWLGRAREAVGNLDGAKMAYQATLSRSLQRGRPAIGIQGVAGLARVAMAQGDLEAAREYVARVLTFIRERGPAQIEQVFRVYWTCIRVLRAAGEDDEAARVLEEAVQRLMEREERIADPALRRMFAQVYEHQEILALWLGGGG